MNQRLVSSYFHMPGKTTKSTCYNSYAIKTYQKWCFLHQEDKEHTQYIWMGISETGQW